MKKTIAMASAILMFIACSSPKTDDKPAVANDSAVAAPAKQMPTEIADQKYVDIGKMRKCFTFVRQH